MPIYCDHNASTPSPPAVVDAMLPYLGEHFANPSSTHAAGSLARCAVEEARREIADGLGCAPAELVFTSGGTEANDIALRGVLRGSTARGRRVLTTAIEHSSVLATLDAVDDVIVEHVPVDGAGRVDVDAFERLLDPSCALVSIGWANNEIGTVQPVAAIAAVCRQRDVPLHVDAVQALGKLPIAVDGIDLLSLSAHKIGGCKGSGALFVRRGLAWSGGMLGGGQERGRRGGTENVPGIVAFAHAVRNARTRLAQHMTRVAGLRDELWSRLRTVDGVVRHGADGDDALPNTLNVRFEGVRGETLVAALDLAGIAVSSGSACAAGAAEPSHVLRALGLDDTLAADGVRYSFGWSSADSDAARIAEATIASVERIRATRRVA